ncbi:5-oxoprolinase subunit PxpB [Alkalihalobacillus pseudalcaliphilus]|uniref:5-oxoprolinase subunit PxpB n=1 Tax=Alkalihalobacillus pseudalcaliphilus TaxID=79884 RepID=UPI000B1CF8FD|nr:5-oxoprolinase subunit PxpB [Alkalihalobacillus pseudalcaliphilus]
MTTFEIQPLGDRAVRISFGDEISLDTQEKLIAAQRVLDAANIKSVEHWLPSYTALTVLYDPLIHSFQELKQELTSCLKDIPHAKLEHSKIFHIPVCYGGQFGPDLEYVADFHQMSTKEVIDYHTEPTYPIYMIGFAPGFPYLGGLNEKLFTPRLSVPREKVYAGSVGIGGKQTGIYPISSPGGWQIIGRTPLQLFQKYQSYPTMIEAGSFLRFISIGEDEYHKIELLVEENKYQWQIEEVVKVEGGQVRAY